MRAGKGAGEGSAELLIEGVAKRFGDVVALDRVSLQVAQGELLTILGPSGSGKTTLLKVVAGFETPDAGRVTVGGADITALPPARRDIGMVFQNYALFPHLSVKANVAFPLEMRNVGKAEIDRRVGEALAMVELAGYEARLPKQLSGGQQQRVALARAIVFNPRLLLLDEPFGALDAKVRKELRRWLRRLHEEMGLTSVFVTHDQEEALELADRVVVMSNGRIEQVGTPDEVYDSPATPFVYEFLGHVNRLPCTVARGRARLWHQEFGVESESAGQVEQLGRGQAYVRPEDVEIVPRTLGEDGTRAKVVHISALGPIVRVELQVQGLSEPIEAELPRARHRELGLRPGLEVLVRARAARVFTDAA